MWSWWRSAISTVPNAHTLSFLFRTDLLAPKWQSEHKKVATEMLEGYLRGGRAAP